MTSKQLALIRVILPTKWRATSIVQGMSGELDRRHREGVELTVTVDTGLLAYAEGLVASGRATSVSAVVNDAIAAQAQPGRDAAATWRAAAIHLDRRRRPRRSSRERAGQ
jgi:hypothetical protein